MTFYHYPMQLRYQDESIIALQKKGSRTVVTAIGREVYALKPEDQSVVYEPFTPFALDPENFSIAESFVRGLIEREVPWKYRIIFAPRVIIHPDKSYVGEHEEQAYRELALSAGAREAVVYVGERLSDEGIEAFAKKHFK